jgi:hypothetical protein
MPRARRPRKAAGGKKGHKLNLEHDVWFRLNQRALATGKDLSTVANEILDRNLPHYRVEVDKAG